MTERHKRLRLPLHMLAALYIVPADAYGTGNVRLRTSQNRMPVDAARQSNTEFDTKAQVDWKTINFLSTPSRTHLSPRQYLLVLWDVLSSVFTIYSVTQLGRRKTDYYCSCWWSHVNSRYRWMLICCAQLQPKWHVYKPWRRVFLSVQWKFHWRWESVHK